VAQSTDDRRPALSTAQVAAMFEVDRSTLQRWIRENKIPEPPRDPESNWQVWGQFELDALARAVQSKRKRRPRK
jgi:predicted site-specific integrase-resolvase